MHLTQSYRLPKDIVDAPYAPAPKSPSPKGTSQHPIVLDLGSDSESDPICCDSPHLSPHSGPCTHQCPRFNVTVPEGWTPFMEWPWLEYEGMAMSMTILIENGILTICSATCTWDGKPCQECQKLKSRLPISRIQDYSIQGVPESTPYKFLSMRQMVKLLRWKDCQINELKLVSLNCLRRLNGLTSTNLDYKQFAMAISQCNAPQVNILMQSALQKKHGIREVIQLLKRAMLGAYHP